MRAAHAPAFHIGAALVGVGQGLQNPPGAEAEQAERDQDQPELAEGLREHGLERAAAALRPSAGSYGGEEGKRPDEAIDHAPRAVAQSGKGLDGIADGIGHGTAAPLCCW